MKLRTAAYDPIIPKIRVPVGRLTQSQKVLSSPVRQCILTRVRMPSRLMIAMTCIEGQIVPDLDSDLISGSSSNGIGGGRMGGGTGRTGRTRGRKHIINSRRALGIMNWNRIWPGCKTIGLVGMCERELSRQGRELLD